MSVRTHLGYIPFEGRMGGNLDNCGKFLLEHKRANMQPVKKVTYSFDPMTSNWNSLRNFMFYWQTKKVKATNVKLMTKTEVLDDRSDPRVLFDLNDGRQLEVKTGNLTELEIATVVNHYLLPLVQEVEEVETVSKGAAKAAGGAKGKKGKKKKR